MSDQGTIWVAPPGWRHTTATEPTREDIKANNIMVAGRNGVLGLATGRNGEDWFINDAYYDGDYAPVWYIVLPPVPTDVA